MIDKVYIYKGSKLGFEKFLKDKLKEKSYTLFLKEIHESDSMKFLSASLQLNENTSEEDIQGMISRFKEAQKSDEDASEIVIFADDYSGIREHVFFNLPTHIDHLNVANLYVHNPPVFLEKSLRIGFKDKVESEGDEYESLTEEKFQEFSRTLRENIFGQEKAINEIEHHIAYSLIGDDSEKSKTPIIILLYGDSGVGKTQTAKFLAESLGGEPFRKQMSMFQSAENQQYLFGGTHSEKSFAKDLVGRETNVILLDEFDKVHPIFHNAFYQFFDEGIYVDTNYSVKIKNAIIICTSNYSDTNQIRSTLGEAIYSRFDAVIKYDSLSANVIRQIVNKNIEEEYSLLGVEQKKLIKKKDISEFFSSKSDQKLVNSIKNARNAKNIVQYYIGKKIADSILNITE